MFQRRLLDICVSHVRDVYMAPGLVTPLTAQEQPLPQFPRRGARNQPVLVQWMDKGHGFGLSAVWEKEGAALGLPRCCTSCGNPWSWWRAVQGPGAAAGSPRRARCSTKSPKPRAAEGRQVRDLDEHWDFHSTCPCRHPSHGEGCWLRRHSPSGEGV